MSMTVVVDVPLCLLGGIDCELAVKAVVIHFLVLHETLKRHIGFQR